MGRSKSQLSQNVLKLVRELGETMAVRRVSNGAYDSATGIQERLVADYRATVVIAQYKKEETERDISILKDDRKAYILPRAGYQPEVGDFILGVGDEVVLVSVRDVLKLGETSMVHVCQVRG
jgi:hypothetical protein